MILAYVLLLGEENLISDYLFTSERVSHSAPDMDFFVLPSLILSHLELSRIELPKLSSSILIEIVTIPVALIDQFYFYMYQSIRAGLFKKIIIELGYHWASLFLNFHIVLNSVVSY